MPTVPFDPYVYEPRFAGPKTPRQTGGQLGGPSDAGMGLRGVIVPLSFDEAVGAYEMDPTSVQETKDVFLGFAPDMAAQRMFVGWTHATDSSALQNIKLEIIQLGREGKQGTIFEQYTWNRAEPSAARIFEPVGTVQANFPLFARFSYFQAPEDPLATTWWEDSPALRLYGSIHFLFSGVT